MKKIRKSFGTSVLKGNVVDSLDFNNPDAAPSARVINEEVKGVVLFENAEGLNTTIALSDSVLNYRHIEILFDYDRYKSFSSLKIYKPQIGNRFTIEAKRQGSQVTYGGLQTYLIEDKAFTVEHFLSYGYNASGYTEYDIDIYGYMRIYKVIGYK